jgi:circadian clock protein KaiB
MKRKAVSNKKKTIPKKAAPGDPKPKYVLRLYVAGLTPRSVTSIGSIRQICDEYLKDRCDLEIVDISREPEKAKEEQIIAAPTLIKKLPLPLRRFIGTMVDRKKIIVGLDLREHEEKEPGTGGIKEPW